MDKTVWVKKCLVISKDTIDIGDSENNKDLDPLAILAVYFSDDKIRKLRLQEIDDPTIQLLNENNKYFRIWPDPPPFLPIDYVRI